MLALVGLHCAGKSYLAARIEAELGWPTCVKRNLLSQLHHDLKIDGDLTDWYRRLYAVHGSYKVTQALLHLMPDVECFVLDSIHGLGEWMAVKEARNDAVLAMVIAPDAERHQRIASQGQGYLSQGLDELRVRYWHDVESRRESSCLSAESQWCFNGAGSAATQVAEIENFVKYYATSCEAQNLERVGVVSGNARKPERRKAALSLKDWM
jgi:hypothetical protein